MKRILNTTLALALLVAMSVGLSRCTASKNKNSNGKVHAVTDLSHEFSFYADHRFDSQYLKGQKGATNWCSLFNFDFSNANLLILLSCADQIAYSPEDIKAIKSFLESGGGVVLLGSHTGKSQNALAQVFGADFKDRAELPFRPVAKELGVDSIEAKGGSYMELQEPSKWTVLAADAAERPVMARMKYGKGNLLVGSRSIAGNRPDAKDSINQAMWMPLLVDLASGKQIDPDKPFESKGIDKLEYSEDHGTFTLLYNDNLKPFATAMVDISKRCMPVIEKRMGVPLSKGMGSQIALLATGGGGFSSGQVIALAVWWGDFPEKEDSMIEFITHESVHSWVLPYPEIWNEPIATYIGNLVMIDMGHQEEAERRIQSTIAQGLKADPKMDLYDVDGISIKDGSKAEESKLRDIHWGKAYWVFEQLRKQDPDFFAKYFQAKRKLATSDKIKAYDMNNTVAVVSSAMGKDMFPWFRQHGFNVNKEKAEIKF